MTKKINPSMVIEILNRNNKETIKTAKDVLKNMKLPALLTMQNTIRSFFEYISEKGFTPKKMEMAEISRNIWNVENLYLLFHKIEPLLGIDSEDKEDDLLFSWLPEFTYYDIFAHINTYFPMGIKNKEELEPVVNRLKQDYNASPSTIMILLYLAVAVFNKPFREVFNNA